MPYPGPRWLGDPVDERPGPLPAPQPARLSFQSLFHKGSHTLTACWVLL